MDKRVGEVIIAGIPVMVKTGLRLGVVYLRFKLKAKRAAAVFERELLAGGMGREDARRLTEMYLESSQIVQMGMRSAMAGAPRRKRPHY